MGSYRIYNRLAKLAPFEGYSGRIVNRILRQDSAMTWASKHLPQLPWSALNFSEGMWDAALPQSTPEEAANDFDHGVLREPPVSEWKPLDVDHFGADSAAALSSTLGCKPSDLIVVPKLSLVLAAARWALEHLASSQTAIVLVREMSEKPIDGLVAWTSPLDVFYPIKNASGSLEDIADLMEGACIVNAEFMILTSSDKLDAGSSTILSDDELIGLVAGAAGVVLGAYDGEGYIRWSREKP